VDALLVKAGSGLVTFGTSSSAGVPEAFANETIVLPLNDLAALKSCFEALSNEIACVIIEPIPANNGLLLQDLSFLTSLRSLCTEYGILLIFDEVISGFRVAFGGAAEHYNITPDIVTYGKIMGGGLPVGAYGAKREIMSFVSPDGPVYQAGTLSGNPVAMAAGLAQLSLCAQENFYEELEKKTITFVEDINNFANAHHLPVELVSIGSIFWFSFNGKKRIAAADQIDADMTSFNKLHHFLLNRGVYFGPSGYEVGFISSVHTSEQLAFAAEQIKEGLKAIYQ
jgi:glutamate-1-semialdehyde 2,1-aminomutase